MKAECVNEGNECVTECKVC